jgi:hypothetical protein
VEFVEQVLLHKKRGVGGVPQVLQEKRGVGLQLHVFLGAEFVELDVFGTVELERSWKNGSRAVPNTPLISTQHIQFIPIIIIAEYASVSLTACIQQVGSAEMKCSEKQIDSTPSAPSACFNKIF